MAASGHYLHILVVALANILKFLQQARPSFTPPTTTPPAGIAPATAHEYPRRPQIRDPAQRPAHP